MWLALNVTKCILDLYEAISILPVVTFVSIFTLYHSDISLVYNDRVSALVNILTAYFSHRTRYMSLIGVWYVRKVSNLCSMMTWIFLSEIVFVYSWCLFIPILMTNCLYLYLMTNSTSVWSMEYKINEWKKNVFITHSTSYRTRFLIFPKAAHQIVAFPVLTSRNISFPTFRIN